MPAHRETRHQGKQYDHEELMHDKRTTVHGGLERHEGEESGYKHPHDRSHASCNQK